ncbi:hypothetical protein F4778DRAFT_212686 [Xylariomycetidae sp. FL2044]|nr:hypothetical protein F4778DRAFT_212686 [Xylariomycetidae sp. FL2044]
MHKLVSRFNPAHGIGVGGHAGPQAFATHVPNEPLLGRQGLVSDSALSAPSYNDNVDLPQDVSAHANPYLNRPLPATPPPEFNMSERPSTSGGPGSKKSGKNNFSFDKRMSRDDSFVYSKAGATSGYTSYASRGQLPTPDASPRSTPAARRPSAPAFRMPTPESMKESGSRDIGMALGSPSHPPMNWGSTTTQSSLQPPAQAVTPVLVSPASGVSSVDSFDLPKEKKQPGRWKLFSKFSRKMSDPVNTAVKISEPNALGGSKYSQQSSVTSFPRQFEAPKLERSSTASSQKALKHKPLVIRSQTAPYMDNLVPTSRSDAKTKRTTDKFGSIPIALDTVPQASGRMLDVEIPSITMERYSVMFGSVLQSEPQQPSLLARRQATVQKLKSIEDAIERETETQHGMPRRATSPQPVTKSPGFALFPPTPSTKKSSLAPPRLSPRMRSNTSPALLESPARANFDRSALDRRHPGEKRPSIEERRSQNPLKHPPTHHTQKGKLTISTMPEEKEQHQFTPDTSSLILESPTDLDSPGFEIVKAEVFRPGVRQISPSPQWQMITPPTTRTTESAASSVTSERKRSPSSSASSARTHVTQPSLEVTDDPAVFGSAKMTPVEISIARQISVSREQRKMLQPLQTNNLQLSSPRGPLSSSSSSSTASSSAAAGRNPPPARGSPQATKTPSPMARMAMGKNERLAETRANTPTLVVPRETLDSQLAQHRKSEMIVFESA